MEYKNCKYINNGINFTTSGVKFCNKLNARSENIIVKYEENFFQHFQQVKTKVINDCRLGIVPSACENCIYLEEKHWDQNEFKISEVEIFHWLHCNCACVYCGNRNLTKLKITHKKQPSEYINLYNTFKKLIKEDCFADNVNISFVGGEPTILSEFNDLMKLFLKKNFNLSVLSNGIKYEKTISKAIKQNKNSRLTISLDCGCRETFKKIKNVDKFNEVIKNIKRYIRETGENSDNIVIKYIIINSLNNNETEVLKWLELCKQLKVKTLHPTIEFCHSINKQEPQISSDECDFYNYIKNKITEYGFNLCVYDFVEEMIKKKKYR